MRAMGLILIWTSHGGQKFAFLVILTGEKRTFYFFKMQNVPFYLLTSRLWIKPEYSKLLITATRFRETCGPCDGLLTRRQLKYSESTIERRRPRVASLSHRAIGRNQHGR